jgi:DNA repair exonuclease SbcCD nuclease subunit
MTNDIRIVHVADIHLGFTGPKNLIIEKTDAKAGRYVREVDIERAFERLVTTIVSEVDPPVDLLLIAGDFFNSRVPNPWAVSEAAKLIHQLVSKPKQPIDIVIIDGNHDNPMHMHAGRPTSYLKEFGPQVHVVSSGQYKIIRDGKFQNERLRGRLAVHCLPYGFVEEEQFTGVMPSPNCKNVLLAHGRISGMPTPVSIGLTSGHIPPHVLRQDWDYIALGDWHVHLYQPLPGVPAYYAGSLEALTFGEAKKYPPVKDDANALRGAIDVRLPEIGEISISTISNAKHRPLLHLKPIEAAGMDADALMSALRERLSDSIPKDALVRLEIKECPRLSWERLDHEEVHQLRSRMLGCDLDLSFERPKVELGTESLTAASMDDQWRQFVPQKLANEPDAEWFIETGLGLIDQARKELQPQQSSRSDG